MNDYYKDWLNDPITQRLLLYLNATLKQTLIDVGTVMLDENTTNFSRGIIFHKNEIINSIESGSWKKELIEIMKKDSEFSDQNGEQENE